METPGAYTVFESMYESIGTYVCMQCIRYVIFLFSKSSIIIYIYKYHHSSYLTVMCDLNAVSNMVSA